VTGIAASLLAKHPRVACSACPEGTVALGTVCSVRTRRRARCGGCAAARPGGEGQGWHGCAAHPPAATDRPRRRRAPFTAVVPARLLRRRGLGQVPGLPVGLLQQQDRRHVVPGGRCPPHCTACVFGSRLPGPSAGGLGHGKPPHCRISNPKRAAHLALQACPVGQFTPIAGSVACVKVGHRLDGLGGLGDAPGRAVACSRARVPPPSLARSASLGLSSTPLPLLPSLRSAPLASWLSRRAPTSASSWASRRPPTRAERPPRCRHASRAPPAPAACTRRVLQSPRAPRRCDTRPAPLPFPTMKRSPQHTCCEAGPDTP
jgi:hypothetical protein